jgi:YesN/AraC family two-component response regulator
MKIYEKLAGLLALLMEESWSPVSNPYNISRKRNLQSVKEYLDEHYQEKVTLESLSEIFYINKFYLTRIFKEQFGLTVNNYLLQIRITHAKQMLRFTDLPIDKIGQECGMIDANYFSRMFKALEGVTPGEFRRNW